MDVVGQEPRTASRRTRVLLLVALLVVVAAVGADRWQRDRSREALLDAVTAAEAVVLASQASQAGLADYQVAILTGPDAGARAAAYENFADDARRWLPRLEQRRSALVAADVLPWHGDLERVRDAYALRLWTWTAVLERTLVEPNEALDRPPAVGEAREAAEQALAAVGGELVREGGTTPPG